MSLPDRILFLDQDGVTIPATVYLFDRHASRKLVFSTIAIAVVNEMCKRTGAVIVTNSTHNNRFDDEESLYDALVRQGVKTEYFHPTDRQTRYPSLDRDVAIQEWLARHLEVDDLWLAVDDVRCAPDRHMVLVDSNGGLDIGHLNQVIGAFGGEPFIVCL